LVRGSGRRTHVRTHTETRRGRDATDYNTVVMSHACGVARSAANAMATTSAQARRSGDAITMDRCGDGRRRRRCPLRQRMVASCAMNASWDSSNNNTTSNTALMETLAHRFLSHHGKRRSTASATATPRAWVLDYDGGETGGVPETTTIKAKEMRVAADVLKSDTARGLQFYNTLRAHERAIIVAKLSAPTIVNAGVGSLPWAVDADIDLEGNTCDLANYCDSCPLREECYGESSESGMCAFECAVRAKSQSPRATYYAAMFRDSRGSFEEYILVSSDVGHRAQRAMFSSKLRASLGHTVC